LLTDPYLSASLDLSALTKLLPKPTEATLVNHVVQFHLLRKQGRRLNTQVKPLYVYFAVGAIARDDQDAEPVDMALEISISLLVGFLIGWNHVSDGNVMENYCLVWIAHNFFRRAS
jgi:hypothetical protein